MNTEKLKALDGFARSFAETADRVNEHSKKRKEIADAINQNIMKAAGLATDSFTEIRRVTQANMEWREKDSTIHSTLQMLRSNIERQNAGLSDLREKGTIPEETVKEMGTLIASFSDSLKRANDSLSDIIEKENDIILLDSLLEYKKKYQIDALRTLKKLSDAISSDAIAAINGSSENMQRGVTLREGLKSLDETSPREIFESLAEEIRKGKLSAENVLKNSTSQEEFNDQLLSFTADFIEECDALKTLVNQKHNLFEENLQTITVFTVIISFEFKKYLDIQKIFARLPVPRHMREEFLTFMMLVEIACRDIKNLTELNYDMTETSHKTNESETRTVEMTDEEHKVFIDLRDQIERMTEMTKVPIEGAANNIEGARKAEEIIASFVKAGEGETPGTDIEQTEIEKEETTMPSKKRIMVIDDGAAIRQVVIQVLGSDGFETIEAVDGQDALNKLSGEKIDMFICDVNMPNMNGIQFLEAIRTEEKYRDYRFTPIIMLTTEAGEAMKEKGKQLGAKAWIVKPFQPDQLLEKIKPLIG